VSSSGRLRGDQSNEGAAKELQVPIYPDVDVRRKRIGNDKRSAANLTRIVHAILRSPIGVLEMLK
jgi:hypothetical protein